MGIIKDGLRHTQPDERDPANRADVLPTTPPPPPPPDAWSRLEESERKAIGNWLRHGLDVTTELSESQINAALDRLGLM